MTVIKGELNDPNNEEILVSSDGLTAIVGDLDKYGDNLEYVQVDGLKVKSPVEIDFLESSVTFNEVDIDEVSHFRYSGRDYSSRYFDDIIMETESMRRAPSVVSTDEGYEVVDGNSYFEAFRERRSEDRLWVRVHGDYSKEDAVDHFLSDHLPRNEYELEEGEWYSDEEISSTLENLYPDLGTEIVLSELEEIDRIGFNVDRMRWK